METTFCEMRAKEVINLIDGKRLGRIVDLVLETKSARMLGIVVPGDKKIFCLKNEDMFIPWKSIEKIGDDVILVKLYPLDDGCDNNKINCNPCRGNPQICAENNLDNTESE